MIDYLLHMMLFSRSPTEVRNFTTFDPVLNTYVTMQTPKTFAGDFEWVVDIATTLNSDDYKYIVGRHLNDRIYMGYRGGLLVLGNGGQVFIIPNTRIDDGKLHRVVVSLVGGTLYLKLDGVIKATQSLVGTLPVTISEIGRRTDSPAGSYHDGVIANVTLTDLTTPSNSESWKLDRPIGTNTEQSSSGNNLLTYVNATKRELFTKVGNGWLGAELWALPAYTFDALEVTGGIPQTTNVLTVGVAYRTSISTAGSNVGDTTGASPSTRALTGNFSVFCDGNPATTVGVGVASSVTARWQVNGTSPFSGSVSMSIKRILEVA